MTDSPLVLGFPSKGRIHDEALAYFARAGLRLQRGSGRDYGASLAPVEGEVRLLSAGEIATGLASGALHAGITGLDVIAERVPVPDDLFIAGRLGFSRARVVVAVPEAWIDVATMVDLYDVAVARAERGLPRLKVATKLLRMTRRFFAAAGIVDYRIVESLGATEGAPASGAADLIVDITETGSTLAANRLKVLDDGLIMASEAALCASPGADWSAAALQSFRQLMNLIEARALAEELAELRVTGEGAALDGAALPAAWGVRICERESGRARLLCRKAHVLELVDAIKRTGPAAIAVGAPEFVFTETNEAFAEFERRRGRGRGQSPAGAAGAPA